MELVIFTVCSRKTLCSCRSLAGPNRPSHILYHSNDRFAVARAPAALKPLLIDVATYNHKEEAFCIEVNVVDLIYILESA
jgi:hypothetical protein